MRRRFLKAAIAAAAALPLSLALTVAPAYAVGCNGLSCNGLDPQAAGCGADATTLDSRTDPGGDKLELRFSAACWAAWVRFTSASYTFTGIVEGFTPRCAPQNYPSCWPARTEAAPFGNSIYPTGRFSNMVSFTYWTRVCELDSYGIIYEATCTAEH